MSREIRRGDALKAPFPYFGGKSKVAPLVWSRFGPVMNYVEAFMGSGAMLLGRPEPWTGPETVNDRDGFICNFWRAMQAAPEEVADWCDWPQNENDLHARHWWLKERRAGLTARLEGDPEYYDAKIAGWWCWGLCLWIGGGWCNEQDNAGPWSVVEGEDGTRQLLHLSNQGQGITRQLLHPGGQGKGLPGFLAHPDTATVGHQWFQALAARLKRVRVCSGDWSRVCGPFVTYKHGLTGVFLDPPYSKEAGRENDGLYATDDLTCAHAVREWAIENGEHPLMRIAMCGYEGEHAMPDSWECVPWKAAGGYGSQAGKGSQANGRANSHRERVWFSPRCLKGHALSLFTESAL